MVIRLPELVDYLKAINGDVLRPLSVHLAVTDGTTDIARKNERVVKWGRLVKSLGRAEAERLVSEWIAKPYKLE